MRIVSVWLALVLAACTGGGGGDAPGSERVAGPPGKFGFGDGPYAAVYFIDGTALLPEYHALDEDHPVEGLMESLIEGPRSPHLTSALPEEAQLLSEEEDEGLVVGMNDAFWAGPRAEITRRAAQVVYTLGNLEEGKRITLLENGASRPVPATGGRPLRPPFQASDFIDLRPWLEVLQPVAGARVGGEMFVRVLQRGSAPVRVEVVAGGKVVGEARLDDGQGRVRMTSMTPAIAVVRVATLAGSNRHVVEVPVRL